jgi:hypothetical protein
VILAGCGSVTAFACWTFTAGEAGGATVGTTGERGIDAAVGVDTTGEGGGGICECPATAFRILSSI